MGRKATKKPALELSLKLKNATSVERWIQRVSEILNVGQGIRGDSLDRNLTLRDLQDFDQLPASIRVALYSNIANDTGGEIPPTYSIPSAITGFTATGGFGEIFLTWDYVSTVYNFFSHIEIWRSATDDLGSATKIGTTASELYVDLTGTASGVFYYWARTVSDRADVGPWNATEGTDAESSLDPQYVIDEISGLIERSDLHADLNSDIGVLETDTGDLLSSYVIKIGAGGRVAGFGLASEIIDGDPVSNFIIHADNFAVGYPGQSDAYPFIVGSVNGSPAIGMNAATYILDLTVTTAKINDLAITNAKIGNLAVREANIASAQVTNAKIGSFIQSNNYVADSTGWYIGKNGDAEFRDIFARGDIEASSLKANELDIVETGHITDLAVETIKIKNQAVTFPVSAYTAAVQTITDSNDDTWITIQQVTLTVSTSGSVNVQFSTFIEGYISADSETLRVDVRVLRDAVDVYNSLDFFEVFSGSDSDNTERALASATFLDTPGVGSRTYYLQAYITGAETFNAKFKNRSLTVIELKK